MKIFFSYGHDEYENIAQRLKRDLETEGFEIWIDKEGIKGTSDWEADIEKGISTSDWLVLLMTEHSVRRPDGVCLDEVSYARFLGKKIAPIMIQEVKPPLCIARIQWIDMKNFLIPGKAFFDEESYQEKKDELLSILNGVQQLNIEGEQKSLRLKLKPLDNDVYSEYFVKDFFGRETLFDYYDKWLESNQRILWLVGDAGIGKTAFVANLSRIRKDIYAVHFCRYNDNERANPKRAIMSIAYYLSTQISDYRQNLLELQDLDDLVEKSTERLFEYLIIEPLSKIRYNGDTVVIVIDALDEATVDGRNELADIIAKHFDRTPAWIKLLVTSRKEVLLERKLAKIAHIDFSDMRFNDNMSDIRGYFSKQLQEYLPRNKKGQYTLDRLVEKSEGIFLYAKTIVDEVHSGQLTLKDIDYFPEGLTGIYFDYFDRIFELQNEFDYKNSVRPVMEVLCAACAPFSERTLCDILEFDEYEFSDISELICEMFPMKNGVIEPIHKSIIDWLTDGKRSGAYRVSPRRGHSKIVNYYLNGKKKKLDRYAVQYLCVHLLKDNRIDEFIEITNDASFFEKRVVMLGLDTTIREMLFELEELHNLDYESVKNIFQGSNFSRIFSKYRKFFYNSGLYFQLKKCGFDEFLEQKTKYDNIEYNIGISYYHYITENFCKTINTIEDIFSLKIKLSPVENVELHNLLALCYRKNVDFEKSKKHFILAFDLGNEIKANYDQSISLVNLGKISYHELDWVGAMNWNQKAILYLKNELDNAEDEDYRISLQLFIAEYHRLIAECLIWSCNLEQVDEELNKAEKIYKQIQNRDRYYIRYLYTKVFRDIMAGNFDDVIEECELLYKQATSSYDKSQILFYRSIAELKFNKKESFFADITLAYEYAKTIGAWLEMDEIVSLASITNDNTLKLTHSHIFSDNNIIKNWVKYVISFMRNILGEIK